MKQFNLEEYLRLKEEGKEPKIVTRDDKNARILCTDRKGHYPIVAAILESDSLEGIRLYTEEGCAQDYITTNHDLFFADLNPEPTYRPYKDAGECFKDVIKHGGWVKNKTDTGHYLFIADIFGNGVYFGNGVSANIEDVFKYDVWADDGSVFGVKED